MIPVHFVCQPDTLTGQVKRTISCHPLLTKLLNIGVENQMVDTKKKPEPKKVGPKKAETKKPEPKKTDPKKALPAKPAAKTRK